MSETGIESIKEFLTAFGKTTDATENYFIFLKMKLGFRHRMKFV